MNFKTISKKKIYIVGLGVSGISLASRLKKSNLNPICWDDDIKKQSKYKKMGLNIKEPKKVNFKAIDFLVLSSGINHIPPNAHISSILAKKSGCSIISDIELLYYLDSDLFLIGITGTNGKSTTTKCIEHILNNSKFNSFACGNIGKPFSDLILKKKKNYLIVEASSYQLERIKKLKFDISLLLNITSDHLERHKNTQNYVNAKLKIFENQTSNDYAIISVDDNNSVKLSSNFNKKFNSKLIKISTKKELKDGIFLIDLRKNIKIIDNIHKVSFSIRKIELKGLIGIHNFQNILASYTICKILGISEKVFIENIKKFKGLEHRLENFMNYKNISFYNDSKATNTISTCYALSSLKNIYWIVGGRAKSNGLKGIEGSLKFVKKTFIFGEAAKNFSKYLNSYVKTKTFHTMEEAIDESLKLAKKEKIKINILLSPACASFDQFESFEDRGNFFKKIIHKIISNE